jgi:predicted phosphodiesterase
VVVIGHSHKLSIARKGKVMYINLGSAGTRRFALPISLSGLLIEGARVTARIAALNPPSTRFV